MTDMKIKCKWLEEDEQILVNPDGQVIPCCYLSPYFAVMVNQDKIKQFPQKWEEWDWDDIRDQLVHLDSHWSYVASMYLFKEYMQKKDELNIFTNDLESILESDWFTKILPESWTDIENVASPCRRICGDGKKPGEPVEVLG